MDTIIFALGITSIFIHELDAIRAREWKLFLVLKDLSEQTAYSIWVFSHIPLFLIPILVISKYFEDSFNFGFRIGFNMFLIVHLIIHYYFRRKKEYRFNSKISIFFILTSALFGLADLIYLGITTAN